MKKRNFRARTEDYNNELRKLGILKPAEETTEETTEDFNNLSKRQIAQKLTELGVSTSSSMRKDELINLLEETLKKNTDESTADTDESTADTSENTSEETTETALPEQQEETEENAGYPKD